MPTFDENPILNSPYHHPKRHWELDKDGRPLNTTQIGRRPSIHRMPIPQSSHSQETLNIPHETDTKASEHINEIRNAVNDWRVLPVEKWRVTYVTQKFLQKWRAIDDFGVPLFFCQCEAAETLVWLNEVAPHTAAGRRILARIKDANEEANPSLLRYATKMATGAGKTTVMAMMIAYHTVNKLRQPKSPRFCKDFLIVTPNITIKDRLRVLYPNDSESYYHRWNIVPDEFRNDINKAKIVITNYHAFERREKTKMSSVQRDVLQGINKNPPTTKETEGQMLERAVGILMKGKDVLVINDEAHHCYRHKIADEKNASSLSLEERDEMKKGKERAHLWISGIEALSRSRVNVRGVYDLSATPFFLRGSGYREGRLFPWVVSDFSLMDAIECGIVKLPRVPIADDAMTDDKLPLYRNLYPHVRKGLPRKGRSKQEFLDPSELPSQLMGALEALYSNYEKTFAIWQKNALPVPPVFIIVCNNTSTSKLVYDYVSGYEKNGEYRHGEFPLFDNIGDDDKPLAHMNTLLIDSEQLESGEKMSDEFKKIASHEIEKFKNELSRRFPERDQSKLSDEALLREVMNTVGKQGKLGEQIRCVVSVSMLSEGWDANNVTHILGCRAFSTQLLCEQVVGRALRRYDYELQDGLFKAEYADIFGVPFTFAKGTTIAEPSAPQPQYHVHAVPERDALEIRFPRVVDYYIAIPDDERLKPNFDENSRFFITPELAASRTRNEAIVGEGVTLRLEGLKQRREKEIVFFLAREVARRYFPCDNHFVSPARFRDLIPIVSQWLEHYVRADGGTLKQYLLWQDVANVAVEKIHRSLLPPANERSNYELMPRIHPYNKEGTSFFVNFYTRRKSLFATDPEKCHISHVVYDSDWEMNFCKALEGNKNVHSYVHNDHNVLGYGLRFVVPYQFKKRRYDYYPDYIVRINDGNGTDDLLNVVVEIKGFKNDKAKAKADTMNKIWIPAINNYGKFGRWAFVEIRDMNHAREILASYDKDWSMDNGKK